MPTVIYLCKLLIKGYLGIIHYGVEQDEKLDLRTVVWEFLVVHRAEAAEKLLVHSGRSRKSNH